MTACPFSMTETSRGKDADRMPLPPRAPQWRLTLAAARVGRKVLAPRDAGMADRRAVQWVVAYPTGGGIDVQRSVA
jgi:hypothetical protein